MAYTSPASASDAATFVSTAVTFCSRLAASTVTPAVESSFAEAAPQGTSGAHSTVVTSARSASAPTPPGLPVGTAITRVLEANNAGSTAASVALSMLASSADANTSAGAPSRICVTRVDEPSYTGLNRTPGFSAVKASPIASKAPLREAAA